MTEEDIKQKYEAALEETTRCAYEFIYNTNPTDGAVKSFWEIPFNCEPLEGLNTPPQEDRHTQLNQSPPKD